jgi:hypothetical protein
MLLSEKISAECKDVPTYNWYVAEILLYLELSFGSIFKCTGTVITVSSYVLSIS